MTDHRIRNGVVGVTIGASMLLIACTSGSKTSTTPTSTPMAATATAAPAAAKLGTETGAAQLLAGLTAQLQEHVYLASGATNAALNGGDFNAAAAALDVNSVALSKSIESVYGADAGKAFLELWRKHIGFFVNYTQGKAANDTAKMAKAKADLDGYRADFGAFLASANPNLTKDAVATELVPHVATLFAVIDAQAAKDPGQYEAMRTAASHMPHTAMTLAGAIVKQKPQQFSGSVDAGGAQLLTGLTAQLQEHVYLASGATNAALNGGDFKAAAAALDANSVALSKSIGSVYGGDAEKAFLELWRKHIGFFVDYTQGKASNDAAKMAKAKADLDGYRGDFGAFLASANPNLTKDAVAAELVPHVATLIAVIDAQASKAPGQYAAMSAAAMHMPHTAMTLAGAIAKQKPQQFN